MTTTKKKTEAAKRGPGRPATGRTSETRGVTLSKADWEWIDAQGESRSKVIAKAIEVTRSSSEK